MRSRLARLDSIHQSLAKTTSAIAPQLCSVSPGEKEWSVAEVLEHLVLVDERVKSELEKGLQSPTKVGLLRKLIPMRFVSWRFFKVKAPRAVCPTTALPVNELMARYDQARTQLKQLCTEYGSQRLKQTTFKHPFLGNIDGLAAISMVAFHEQRHHKQIKEILKKLDKSVR
jgi:hypothetical protein